MSPKSDPTLLRYFKARLMPIARPIFWAPIGLLGLSIVVFWQFKNHPEWWATTTEQPESTESRSISDPTFPIPDTLAEGEFPITAPNSDIQSFLQPTEPQSLQDPNSLLGKKSNATNPAGGILPQFMKQQETQSSSENSPTSDPVLSFFQPNYKAAFKGNNSSQKPFESIKSLAQESSLDKLSNLKSTPGATGKSPLAEAVNQVFSNNSDSALTAPRTTNIDSQPSLPQGQTVPQSPVNRPNYNTYLPQAPQQSPYNQPYSNPYATQAPQQSPYNQPYSNPYVPQAPQQSPYNQP
ncbi:MAG: hypothetical protein ACRDEA_20735, partial [Microcystaceae cyanobacterium]